MEHEVHHGFPLIEVAFVIAMAAALGLMLMRLRQPPLVGFIIAGILLGPTGYGLIDSNENVTILAEMGVLMLLFFIGMELSLKAFVVSLKPAVIIATGQMVAAFAASFGISLITNASWQESVILGFIIALSSTVVAMKVLDDMGELRGQSGRIAIAVLIAQDIAIVPMLIIISSLGGEGVDPVAIGLKVGLAVVVLVGLLWWLGNRPKIFLPLSETIENNVEMLALGALTFCFAGAALSGLAGLSPAYGAFVAGLVLGSSSLRNHVIPVILPIQSVLLVVFFLSIGLLIDLTYIWTNLDVVMLLSFLVIFTKTLINILLLRLTGYDHDTALVGGLSMAQIGEFSFVLAAAGVSAGVLGGDNYRLAIAVIAVTLLVSPAWMAIMHRIQEFTQEGYSSYREALKEAYAGEIGNVSYSFMRLRLRYRAGRMALRRRRMQRAAARQAPVASEDDMRFAVQSPLSGKEDGLKAPEAVEESANHRQENQA